MMLKNKPIPLERQDHIALVSWAAYHPICKDHLIHIPNESKCHPIAGRHRVLMGVKRGISDFFLAYPSYSGSDRSFYYGLWLELKRVKMGRVSLDQRSWIEKMKKAGYAATVAYGFDQAKAVIDNYLNGITIE